MVDHSMFRIVSRWIALAVGAVVGLGLHPVATAAPSPAPFPSPPTKKGLQVQMVDDAVALGLHHAAINVSLGALWDMKPAPHDPAKSRLFRAADGAEYRFNLGYVRSLDSQIKPLSDAGALLYAILLSYRTGDPVRDAVLIHPQARADHKYTIAAFNTVSPEGRAWLRATAEFLAQRYRPVEPGQPVTAAAHGTVWGWIVGNEANSHWMWYNRGLASEAEVAGDYEAAVRLWHQGVRTASAHSRVYLSFDHHWTGSMPGISAQESLPGRSFLDAVARMARERGDFDWHVATHPYPDDLGNPRTWLDTAAPASLEARHITFKNLEQQVRYMNRPELLYAGQPRRIILSEQGFHCLKTPDGEQLQAAGYVYAWEKCRRLPTVDCFILHRHVDHAGEGGLRLGLFENAPGSVCSPGKKRPIWDLMRLAGTPEWDAAARPFLATVGLTSWDELTGP
jgi:Family of unknown function (DUF5722)